MDLTEITKYINMALRRKYWIIIPFLLTLLVGFAYGLRAPKIYQAETLILVQPQEVPQDFVRPVVTTDMDDRLTTITQQVTSRTNLEHIIKQYDLFSSKNGMPMEAKVASLRRSIDIEVSRAHRGQGTNSFSIIHQGKDPEKVKGVTNALASNFITENLKIREAQAQGTSTFLADELESVEAKLKEKEAQLKQYREKYMGGLPEQLETNLSILERLETRLEGLNSSLRDARNRKVVIQQRITEAREGRAMAASVQPDSDEDQPMDLASLKSRLATLESRYTEKHPDVIQLKKRIEKVEAQVSEEGSSATLGVTPVDPSLTQDLEDVNLQINNLGAEIWDVEAQVRSYQEKVEATPKREQELLSLRRDYENLRELYDSLLNRKLEAELAVNMERKQKGEQFRVIDPAKKPTLPLKPDLLKIFLATFALGLALGCGLAYLKESMDTSYKIPHEVEKELALPVLASFPIRYTEKELKMQKRKSLLANVSLALGFIISAFAIVVVTKGFDETLNYIQDMLDKI